MYDKNSALRPAHASRRHRKAGEAIICEYTDVICAPPPGSCNRLPRAARLPSRALSADRLVLSFDADAASLAATERVYTWEKEYELDIGSLRCHPALTLTTSLAGPDLHRAVDQTVPFLKFASTVLDAGDIPPKARRSC